VFDESSNKLCEKPRTLARLENWDSSGENSIFFTENRFFKISNFHQRIIPEKTGAFEVVSELLLVGFCIFSRLFRYQ
jgi:hypothetical protein